MKNFTPEHKSAAQEIVNITIINNKNTKKILCDDFINSLGSTINTLPDADKDAFINDVAEYLFSMATSQESIDTLVNSYCENFVQKDLEDLSKFYKTPLGERLRGATQAIVASFNRCLQERVEANSEEFNQILMKYFPE